MRKNLKRYYQAWQLRKKGLKLREIGEIMGLSKERVRFMANYMDFYIKKRKKLPKYIKRKLK